ncbi:huntingtin-interacting protein 1-like isoform X1 [Centruroides sculpturatus]|uniref:huntingtin-interacting protein 1-like isoform X1 n=1 Tax=Centruroides sculpturatus TaxID=218467 RepID=UPI000C6D0399|nr:huntingtin-interacting protein 1-like isoform X1 [Centruroides sculpturatus]
MSLPLSKVLAPKRGNSLDVERENFEKTQTTSISKAINNHESPVKEKHVRNAILGTFREKGAGTFWSVVMKLPLQGNPIVCWKFCHVLHKLLREGHQHVIPDSQRYKSHLTDLGKLWGLLKEGYGRLISCYCNVLLIKLDFHRRNPRFPGNMIVTDEELDDIGEKDVNVFFQLTCEMFDYMEEILALQAAVFGSLDMSRSNSMTNTGQCRLAPLIPCIQDSSLLYDYIVKVLFKLHAALSQDTLTGHRERFLKQFKGLQQFYINSSNLQYFKYLIQVPLLPDKPPNFLVASDLNTHVSPVVILPPQTDTPENEFVEGHLVDTSVPPQAQAQFEDVFGSGGMGEFNFQQRNGSISPNQLAEKDRLVEQLLKEIEDLKMELKKMKIEYERQIDDLKRLIITHEGQIAELEKRLEIVQKEKEDLEQQLTAATTIEETLSKATEAEKKAKCQEEKFYKMKEVYTKLREEHIALIRSKAEADKQITTLKTTLEDVKASKEAITEKLQLAEREKSLVEGKLQKSANYDAELATVTALKKQLEEMNKKLLNDLEISMKEKTEMEENINSLNKSKEQLEEHIKDIQQHRDTTETQLNNQLDRYSSLFDGIITECCHNIEHSLDEFENPFLAAVTCTPEYLLYQAEVVKIAAVNMKNICCDFSYNSPEINKHLQSLTGFSHLMADFLIQGKTTTHSSSDLEKADELVNACRTLGLKTIDLFNCLRSKDNIMKDKSETMNSVLDCIETIASLTDTLVPNITANESQSLSDMVEEELSSMDRIIEEAALRIEELLKNSRAGDTGIKLEVNGKILDACTNLMRAIKVLVESSKDLQEEIISQGKGSVSVKEFYSRNHRWTEGLISAAKVVGLAAKFLVDAADKVVRGNAKFEELVVASQEIAAATAQLVVASKVKAEKGSERMAKLSNASRQVSECTGNVVATAKNCAQLTEESEVMDFTKLTLHQAKKLEMESQVHLLELESALVKERARLAGLRKQHYHLAGASEGWEEEDVQQ